jgi:ubiquitin-like modifier-activating enzyme ATG7
MPIVQFQPFSSLVQPSFWHSLTDLKIDVLRLSDDFLPVSGSYAPGRTIRDRETGQEIDLGCHLSLSGDAFREDVQ